MIEAVLEEIYVAGRLVVRGARLRVEDGRLVLLVGPNGSGKTSIVRAIAGLGVEVRGRVVIDGVDVTGLPPSRRRVGVVLQGAPVLPGRTAVEHVALPLMARGVGREEALREAEKLLERVGASHLRGRRVEELSGGERARVALATAMAMGRNLVLDEAFAAVDPRGRLLLYSLIAELKLEGRAILATSHHADQLAGLADEVLLVSDGRVVAGGDEWLAGGCPYRVPYDCSLTPRACELLELTGRGVLEPSTLVAEPGGPWRVAAIRGSVAALVAGGLLVFARVRGPLGVGDGASVSVTRRRSGSS